MKRGLLLCFLILSFVLSSCAFASNQNETEVHILDVGKADCIVIQTKSHVVMIDTGEEENLPEILTFLDSKRIRKVDALILSHFDKDHIGGAERIIRDFDVDEVFESTFESDREEFGNYHNAITETNTKLSRLSQNRTLKFDDCSFTILCPEKGSYQKKEDNNASLIVEMNYQNNNLLFCGDAMEERLNEFIAQNTYAFDFVKLPYHGRYLENYPEFLNSVRCVNAAICDSNKNPAEDQTIKLLEKNEISYHCTKNGNIELSFQDDKINIKQ